MGRRARRFSLLVALFAGLVPAPIGAAAADPAVGERAPDFELNGSDGKVYSLRDLLGKGGSHGIVLAWFPKAFTPG